MTSTRTLLALSLALAFPAMAPTAHAQDDAAEEAADEGVTRFAGTWRYSGSAASGTQIISRAVDRTVEPMNIFIRAIAAGRLRGKNQLVRRITISVSGETVTVDFDGNRSYRAQLGQWRRHTFDGDSINVQFRYQRGSLVQLFRSDGGSRRNVYRMLPNGRMRLDVTVQSEQLPRDMRYQLVYRQ